MKTHRFNEISVMGVRAFALPTKVFKQVVRSYTQYRVHIPRVIGDSLRNRRVVVIVVDVDAVEPEVITPALPQYEVLKWLLRERTYLIPARPEDLAEYGLDPSKPITIDDIKGIVSPDLIKNMR